MYKLQKNHSIFGEAKAVTRLTDNSSIPFDPDNTDYQTYLKWVAEGNTPLPAENT
jgi:hypothetical protein